MDWVRRPYDPATDEDGVLYMWIRSYAHSSAGLRRGAHIPKSSEARAWWDEHRPFVLALMKQSSIEVICDPEQASVLWGWVAAQGDTLHYLSVKKSVTAAGFGVEVVQDLLGERLNKPCAYTMELVELQRMRGLRLPRSWYPDFTFHMRGVAA